MIYVVLGMHKSGTTLVSQLLHRAGIDMGTFDDARGYDEGNVYERRETQILNRRLLEGVLKPVLSDRLRRRIRPRYTYDGRLVTAESLARIGEVPVEAGPALEREMRRVVDDLDSRFEHWGFKDPRTCLTYPMWRRVLPPHRIIAVYRDYRDLVHRWRQRPFPLRRLVANWVEYNERMLAAIENGAEPYVLLRYDHLMAQGDDLERLSRFVGRPLEDARRPDLHRNRGGDRDAGLIPRATLATLGSRPRRTLSRLENLGRNEGEPHA